MVEQHWGSWPSAREHLKRFPGAEGFFYERKKIKSSYTLAAMQCLLLITKMIENPMKTEPLCFT